MSKYSSVLFGAERYEKIGPFRFPVWNELVPGEIKGIEKIVKRQAKSTFQSIKLAQKIAADKGISTQEAVEMLSTLNTDDNQEIVFAYAEEMDAIQSANVTEYEQKLEVITLFMRYRAEVKLPGNKEWSQTNDWTMEDTENTPNLILDQINDFIQLERNGGEKPEESEKKE